MEHNRQLKEQEPIKVEVEKIDWIKELNDLRNNKIVQLFVKISVAAIAKIRKAKDEKSKRGS